MFSIKLFQYFDFCRCYNSLSKCNVIKRYIPVIRYKNWEEENVYIDSMSDVPTPL